MAFAILIMLGAAAGAVTDNEGEMLDELAPTGPLRVGVAFAPAPTAFFVTLDAAGAPHGVTVDLGTELAHRLGVPVAFVLKPNSGELTEATSAGAVDVAFMPVDDERRKKVDFGPPYYLLESTYLVAGGSGIKTLADVDRPGVRVVGIANTTTIRSAERSLHQATLTAATTVDETMELMRSGRVDAIALSRDALRVLAGKLPGSRILDGGFQMTGIAIAVAKNRPAALAYVSAFIESAKASGLVRRAFDAAGLESEAVAPPDGTASTEQRAK